MGSAGGGWMEQHHGWRAALLVFGAAGLPLAAVVVLGFREPGRGVFDVRQSPPARAGFRATLEHILRCRSLLHVIAGTTVLTFWGWGLVWWTPSFLVRSFQMTVGGAGEFLGVVHGVGGVLAPSLPRLGEGLQHGEGRNPGTAAFGHQRGKGRQGRQVADLVQREQKRRVHPGAR